MLRLLILGLVVAADTEVVDDTKALICLTLTKVRMSEDQSQVSAFIDSCALPTDEVHSKVLTDMLLHCYDHVTEAAANSLAEEMDTFQLNDTLRELVPLPIKQFTKPEELLVGTNRKLKFSGIVDRAKYIQQVMEYTAVQEMWYSGKTGLFYMLGVFALFGLGMVKLFRGLSTTAKKGKKTK